MNRQLLHTPEGVRDIYGKEYANKLSAEKKIQKQLNLYGYQDIQTPTFEFFDVFSKEPPQCGDKLITLDNFYLTSHIGARTEEAEKRTCNLSAEKIINHFQ